MRIDRYDVLGRLAVGGMAEILLARLLGPNGFERAVVLKRVLPHLANQRSFREMFLDEARVVASIHHPNVVQVQELVSADGNLFLVMEYLEGESVAGLVRRLHARGDTLDRSLAGYIVAEACAGLHAAHELIGPDDLPLDLVHRDVSPQNVFVTYDGHIKVIDFGIARFVDRIGQTEAGQLRGKFEYMSPEQCRAEPLDRRTDIFALGILLYELTTGVRLFRCDNPAASIHKICTGDVTPPSRLDADYPPELERVCLRALSSSREDRYATAAEMRRDLLAALRVIPSTTEPDEALSMQMRELFADRVAIKNELLRRMRSGSKVMDVPPGEADLELDVTVEDENVVVDDVFEPTEVVVGAVATRRRVALAAAGVLAVAALGAAILLLSARSSDATRSADTVPTVASAAPTSEELPSLERPPTSVLVHVESRPTGAQVWLNGEKRGVTPLELEFAKSEDPSEVELRSDGYVNATRTIVPRSDQHLLLELTRVVARGSPRASRPSSTTPASSPAPAKSPWEKWN